MPLSMKGNNVIRGDNWEKTKQEENLFRKIGKKLLELFIIMMIGNSILFLLQRCHRDTQRMVCTANKHIFSCFHIAKKSLESQNRRRLKSMSRGKHCIGIVLKIAIKLPALWFWIAVTSEFQTISIWQMRLKRRSWRHFIDTLKFLVLYF